MSLIHPAKEQLIAFGQGKLATDESSSVEQHLEVCRECCETLLDLKDDTFVGLVKVAKLTNAVRDLGLNSLRSEEVTSQRTALNSGLSNHKTGFESEQAATHLNSETEDPVDDERPPELADHSRYRIVGLLGRGGMGNVYRAEHRLMSRPVAIKLINPNLIQNRMAVERFRREVQAAAKLSHPNIVAAFDAEQAGDVHFLVMEFVEGTDLASVVKQRGPTSVIEACECIQQAAAGLQHAHEKGMVHRDIKPHNLMLAAGGQVRVLDFGLAGFAEAAFGDATVSTPKRQQGSEAQGDPETEPSAALALADASGNAAAAHLTTMGSVMGTPDYMAPEQAVDAHSADIRADIYSLGCTLHFLLTGRPPFEREGIAAKLKAHASVTPPSLTEVRSDVPQALSDIVARMMAKRPENRFQTPDEVVAVLEPFVRPPVKDPKRRWRTLVAAVLVLVLLAGVIFVRSDKGRIEIQSEVDDVAISIRQGGKEIEVVDAQTGSRVTWFPSGEYQVALKGNRNDVVIEDDSVTVTRWGRSVVTIKRRAGEMASSTPPPMLTTPATENAPQSIDTQNRQSLRIPLLAEQINLLSDGSFENTPLTQLPEGWRGWLNDGKEFRCEVVAGGHKGQRCLKISGKGTRGVVFANDMKADRSKRYTLKGWAKFEGDKDARAIIKFNYFRGGEFLGVHDLVGATADQPGWHLFEKTDSLDVYPTADHFYAMCHVEGTGTGWFDDLDLVAYDRDKLPEDFDLRHGRHNRLHGPNSLHRWVGTWDTEYAFREFDNSPTETRLTMTTVSERTLGDTFLLSHSIASPTAPKNRKPTPADPPANAASLGGEVRLTFLTFDQNLGAFRQWIFGSNGKVFEGRGPWNNEKQTLELRMLPDASNLHSAEHFVDADHIEARLKFQYVMGQRDAGRWTATRKAFDGKVDVPMMRAPYAETPELSQLNKFAGEWTIRAKYKPSVWNPLPREETIRETSVWILGGRFLMTRAFNENDELTSIWIATYEPREKSNRFWFFNAHGSSGEWRLTWDEAASGFQSRAIDMPSGWTGTGFNHWVDEDTFDNTALIKDETGRVLLDSTQERRRYQ